MRRVGAALADRYADIGRAIAARAFEEIPAYSDAAPELIGSLQFLGSPDASGRRPFSIAGTF